MFINLMVCRDGVRNLINHESMESYSKKHYIEREVSKLQSEGFITF